MQQKAFGGKQATVWMLAGLMWRCADQLGSVAGTAAVAPFGFLKPDARIVSGSKRGHRGLGIKTDTHTHTHKHTNTQTHTQRPETQNPQTRAQQRPLLVKPPPSPVGKRGAVANASQQMCTLACKWRKRRGPSAHAAPRCQTGSSRGPSAALEHGCSASAFRSLRLNPAVPPLLNLANSGICPPVHSSVFTHLQQLLLGNSSRPRVRIGFNIKTIFSVWNNFAIKLASLKTSAGFQGGQVCFDVITPL